MSTTRPRRFVRDWTTDPEEIYALAEWLERECLMPPLPEEWRDYFDKPHKWSPERLTYERVRREEDAA